MNDVNYDLLNRWRIFIHVSNAGRWVHTIIDNLIKRYRAFRVLGENVFEKIKLRTCLFFSSGRVKSVCSSKITSNNLLFHCHHELKGIQWQKERDYCKKKNLFQLRAFFGMEHKRHAFRCNNYYPLYKISWYISILLSKRYLSTLLSCDYEVLFLLLLVA